MHLRYVLFGLLVLLIAGFAACSSSSTKTAQENLVEEYFLNPAAGEDAAKLAALEKEIVSINNRKEALVKEDHIFNLAIREAEEDLVYEEAKSNLLKAQLNLAVGQNEDALVNKAKADIANNELEIVKKECALELLKMQQENGSDEMDLRDAELAAKLAEWDYNRAKIARVNQDKHFSTLSSVEESERIDVSYFEERMNQLQGNIDGVREDWEKSSADVKAKTDSCQNISASDNISVKRTASDESKSSSADNTISEKSDDKRSDNKAQQSQTKTKSSSFERKSGSSKSRSGSPNVRGSQGSDSCF